MCGCGYLNGPFQIVFGQLFMFGGLLFSLAATGDCAFVETVIPVPVYTSEDDLGDFTKLANRLGMFTYENLDDGYCYHWTDTSFATIEDQVQYYIKNVLGPDWNSSINLASAATVISFLIFVYLTSYCCSSHIRPFRYVAGFFIAVILTLFQGLALLVYRSDWCDQYQCSFGRSAIFAVVALVCFLFSGIIWCLTTDYPGASATTDTTTNNNKGTEMWVDPEDQTTVAVEHLGEPFAVTGTEQSGDHNENSLQTN